MAIKVSQQSTGCQTNLWWWDKCKSKLWKQVSESGSNLDHWGTWPGMGKDPWQGTSERAGNWVQLLSKEGSTSPLLTIFSHAILSLFLNNLNHDYAAALCQWWLENREIPWSRTCRVFCTQNTGKCLQVFSCLRFCYFFHILCFFWWNI